MNDAPQCRVLAIMGSGETSPTMVTVHKALVARLGSCHSAVLLDTPYAFQENAADVSAKSVGYFARSVGMHVTVVSDADLPAASNPDAAARLAAIRSADWVFAGPGSPSYLLRRWRGGPVAAALRDRVAAGPGITVIASAAAAAIGLLAVPVYEIYKAGADPHWLEGLDLLSVLGLKVVVIPHYDNAEGGTHDTRFCYLGERRLAMLEPAIPADAAVLGVDEHTALIFDLAAQSAEVVGRGGATVRKAGRSVVLPAGSVVTMADLRALIGDLNQQRPPAARPAGRRRTGGGDEDADRGGQPEHGAENGRAACRPGQSLGDVTRDAQRRFESAIAARDAGTMVSAILDLHSGIDDWATDTDENDDPDTARSVLRALVVRLGKAAEQGLADPRERLRPAVQPLVELRAALRGNGDYQASDQIRDALSAIGVRLRDTPDGTMWTLT